MQDCTKLLNPRAEPLCLAKHWEQWLELEVKNVEERKRQIRIHKLLNGKELNATSIYELEQRVKDKDTDPSVKRDILTFLHQLQPKKPRVGTKEWLQLQQ